jgi:hypothetical protein
LRDFPQAGLTAGQKQRESEEDWPDDGFAQQDLKLTGNRKEQLKISVKKFSADS